MIRALYITLLITLLGPATAAAEQVEITAQAKAARADFLLRAVAPGPAATICLVDTGVNVNPDTTAVVDRLKVTGEATDQSPTKHGTQMAMFIGAAANGYGMVGIWPAARIVSVRANVPDQDVFTPAGYINGVKLCNDVALLYGIKIIALPFSSELALSSSEAQALTEEVEGARQTGISVVGAAGNNYGRPVGAPANINGVLPVGASDSSSGGLCTFSATGALLLAPGCAIDGADPVTGAPSTEQQGTSHAAAIAVAALSALRTWRPDLSPADVDRVLNETATPSLWGPNLDLAAAFRAVGLAAVAGPPASSPVPSPTPLPSPLPQVKRRLSKPKITARSHGRGKRRILTVKAANRPRGARLTVRVYVRGRGGKLRRVATRTRSSATVRIRIGSWRRVTAQFIDPTSQLLQSSVTTLKASR